MVYHSICCIRRRERLVHTVKEAHAGLSRHVLHLPEDAGGDAAVEFGFEIGECRGMVGVPRRVFQRLLPERPTPERCVETY